MAERLYLVDGSALAYRSYFAFIRNPLVNSKGDNTGPAFAFVSSLMKLVREEKPEYLAIVFDSGKPTFRHEAYPEYKATREKMPDEMREQLPRLDALVEALNIVRLDRDGFEADDIIGTLAKKAGAAGLDTVIYSGDKDFMQLVDAHTKLMNPRGNDGPEGEEAVEAKFGVRPDQVIDMLGLMGDASDNVPGVPGVGQKTAQKLLAEYGSMDGIYEHVDGIKQKKLKEKLVDNKELAYLSRRLVTIDTAMDMELELGALKLREFDNETLTAMFRELEFTSLVKEVAEAPKENTAEYATVDTMDAFGTLLARISAAGRAVIDLETTSIDPLRADIVGIAVCLEAGGGYYVPVAHTAAGAVNLGRDEVLASLKPLLEDPDIAFTGQNIKYDYLVLARTGIRIANVAFDTMVASYVINPSRRQHNLDALALELLHLKMISYDEVVGPRERGKEQPTIDTVPVADVTRYAGEDADMARRLEELFSPQLEERGGGGLFRDIEMPLVTVLARMEEAGVKIDTGFLAAMSVDIDAELTGLVERIYGLAGEEFNINSTQQLGAILFDKLGLPRRKKTKTGYSTNVDVLESLADKHELPRVVLEYRMLTKLKSTYVDALQDMVNPETGRVHTSYNQTVTSTGRLSSTDPNLQNIPVRTELGRRVRKAFVAEGGNALILAADYSQIELRVMAHLARDETLIGAFAADDDIHAKTAALVFNVFPEMVSPELRRRAKAVNFGIIYGQGPYGLGQQLGISVKEARGIIDGYFVQYPGVKAYMDGIIARAHEDGYVETMLGRRRYLPEITGSNKRLVEFAERMAINTPIQGTAADMIKVAMIRIDRELRGRNLGTRMIMQVHDELVFEVPVSEKDEVEALVRDGMEHALELDVPLKVDIGLGVNWFEAH